MTGRREHGRRAPGLAALPLWATALVLVLAAAPAHRAVHAADPEVDPDAFAAIVDALDVGSPIAVDGALVLPLRLPEAAQVPLEARVGLFGALTEIQTLPSPAGTWHVRVANRGPIPILLPAGEALLTPSGPSRVIDRAVWLGAGRATFVPVVQAPTMPPPGPYLSRGRGLTPVEVGRIHRDTWVTRVRDRNRRFGVPDPRRDDVAAVYEASAFREASAPYRERLASLADGRRVVGVLVADDRGLVFAHVEADAKRFETYWPALLDGIVLDALVHAASGFRAPAARDAAFDSRYREMLALLRAPPLQRPTFGAGWEVRWTVPEGLRGRWEGLATPEGPVCLTLHLDPPRARPTPSPASGSTGPGTQGRDDRGRFERARGARESEYERRLRERREQAGENTRPRVDPGATRPPAPQVPAPRVPSPPTPAPQAPAPRAPAPAPGGAGSGGPGPIVPGR